MITFTQNPDDLRLLLETAAITIPLLSLIFYIGVYKGKVNTMFRDIDMIFREIDDVKESIRRMITRVDELYRSMKPVATSDSPMRLIDYGKEILRGSGFADIFREHQDYLIRKVKDRKPKLRYDVQEASLQVMKALVGDESKEARQITDSLKEYAFERGVELDDVLKVAGLYLRDQLIPLLDLEDSQS